MVLACLEVVGAKPECAHFCWWLFAFNYRVLVFMLVLVVGR